MNPLKVGLFTGCLAFVPFFMFNGLYSAVGVGVVIGYFAFEFTYLYKLENNRQAVIGEDASKRWNLRS